MMKVAASMSILYPRVFKKTLSRFFKICSGEKSLFNRIAVFTKTDDFFAGLLFGIILIIVPI